MSPGGGAGWDEPPLDIQVPDDARELDRDVLAYHRELRARRRRSRLRRLASPFARQGTIMPLLASILAVCLVAGAMLSVATFSSSTAPAEHHHQPPAASASSSPQSASTRPSANSPAPASGTDTTLRSAAPGNVRPSARTSPTPHPPGGP